MHCEVVCYCADVGQGEELTGLEEKALATGASKLYVEDLREEFVREYVWTAVKANAVYEGVYLLGTSLARPVIAKRQIEIARREGADAVAHGATGKGNDQVRFELTYYALAAGHQSNCAVARVGIQRAQRSDRLRERSRTFRSRRRRRNHIPPIAT